MGAGRHQPPAHVPLIVYEDGAALAEAAAALVAAEARLAVERSGRFTLALAGGSTPRATYHALATQPLVRSVPWTATHVFWSDERCVPPDDPLSNERMAREALLDHVPIPPEQVHPMRCAEPGMGESGPTGRTAERAAERYERLLRATFPQVAGAPAGAVHPPTVAMGLDLVLLGLGEDGHTASLFPGSAAAGEQQRWVAVSLPDGPALEGRVPNVRRVTLTTPFINLGALVVFLVGGRSKAEIVRLVLETTAVGRPTLPAQLIHPNSGRLLWLLDREAAALLAAPKEVRS